jgi:hypothetical protein
LPYPATAAVSSSVTNAAALAGRVVTSFAMPRATSARTGSGTASTGGAANWCACRSRSVSVSVNGRKPVTHKKNTHVAAYTSVAGVAGAPCHCSGAMYAGVPPECPLWPDRSAMPKSTSLLWLFGCTSTLPGL